MKNGKFSNEEIFWVLVKKDSDGSIHDEYGPYDENKSVSVANDIDVGLEDDLYTEIVERQ